MLYCSNYGVQDMARYARKLKRPDQKIDVSVALKLRLVNKLSYEEIGEKFGATKQSVHAAIRRFEQIIGSQPEELEAYRQRKADLLEAAELQILEKITDPETLQKASLNNAAYTFAQLHNAGRLERGKSTANVDIRHTQEEIEVLDAEYKELQAQLNPGFNSS